MGQGCGFRWFCLSIVTACVSPFAFTQTFITTVNVGPGGNPRFIALNQSTNKVYVSFDATNTMAVIDGTDNSEQNFVADYGTFQLAVNPITNKVYVAIYEGSGSLRVIDGANFNNQQSVPLSPFATTVNVNPVTNKIYTTDRDTMSVIDGVTLNRISIPGAAPSGIGVNTANGKAYVSNATGNAITVIDTNLSHHNIPVGSNPNIIAVNPITNKIYAMLPVAGQVAVIDGVTEAVHYITVGRGLLDMVINPVTNRVYVSAFFDGKVVVIDEENHGQTTSIPVDPWILDLAVDTVRNYVYALDYMHNVRAIDGFTNTIGPPVSAGAPCDQFCRMAVNTVTNRVYVTNYDEHSVTVIGGAVRSDALEFVPVTPCRVVDTRGPDGAFGGPALNGGAYRSFAIPQYSPCHIPATATAYSVNVTVVPHRPLGYLTIWPTGQEQPLVSTLNSFDHRIKANAAILPAGYQGAVSVFVTDTTDVILDIDGYFTPPAQNTLQFYPLTPCRVADTRPGQNFPPGLGAPAFHAQETRDLPILSSPCLAGVNNPRAYSFNVSVVPDPPGHTLDYLSIWPSDQNQPVVSTLNNPTATVVANAAIVPAAANGNIKVFTYDGTHVFLDINGYFATPGGQNGTSFYPAPPCRVLDTRNAGSGQPFVGVLSPPVNVVDSACAPPANAQAYVFNATVVPAGGPMGYLSLWPDAQLQPVVSTLNAYDGFVTSNMAIVPTANGSIDAYADGLTQLILDISGYFAP